MEKQEFMTETIRKEMKKNKVTGLSVVLVDSDRTIWAEGFGYADLATKQSVAADTLFKVGSFSKVSTATAIMQLAEQGKLDIDQPLQTYISEFCMKSRFPEAEIPSRYVPS